MKQFGNMPSGTATKFLNKNKANNLTDTTGTNPVWSSLQGSQQQMGIDYAIKVFGNQNLTPGAANALAANPPFRFYANGLQILLPPPNLIVGAAVPALPDGIQVLWAPSFMGVPIPADMIGPSSAGGHLTIQPLEIMSAGGDGGHTNAALSANNKVLLNLLMSVMGALINSYSSRPYSNPQVNNGAFGTLSHYVLDLRNKADFLSPQADPGSILQQAINTVATPFATVAGIAANVVVPGSGAAVTAAQKSIAATISGGSSTSAANNVSKTLTTQLAPSTSSTSTWLYIGGGLLLVVVIIYFSMRKK